MTESHPAQSPRIDAALAKIRSSFDGTFEPVVGIVLGSGLGALADRMEIEAIVPYDEIPGFNPSTVPGHAGRLCLGRLGNVAAAVMQGRIHLYEGHDVSDVVLPIRVLCRMGIEAVVVTNAAGGINPSMHPGDLMLIEDHLNLTGRSPLLGPNEDAFGPRFPDMSEAYDRGLRALAEDAGREARVDLASGVYAGLLGPTYETPAEVRMLRTLGADAVGMSTVLEVIAARHLGTRVAGLSVISNLAAGLSSQPLTHDEVKEVADLVQDKVAAVLEGLTRRIAGAV